MANWQWNSNNGNVGVSTTVITDIAMIEAAETFREREKRHIWVITPNDDIY